MSLAIEPENVIAVLLADGWHSVQPQSFDLDAYEFCEATGDALHGGGVGFTFTSSEHYQISGPLTSVLAVEHR